jgi:ubiquitin-protein ligase E3 C
VLANIVDNILTIPDLPNRVSRTSLTQMVVELPLIEIVDRIVALHGHSSPSSNIHVLANLLAIGWKRVPHLTKAVQVSSYLLALTMLQDDIPSDLLRSSQQANGKSLDQVMLGEEDDEGATSSKDVGSNHVAVKLSAATLTRLQILPSQAHISAVLTASARFPSTTREVLSSFLISTLQSWDPVITDQVLACITYRHSSSTNSSSNGTAKPGGVTTHSIEGLIRELYRGWVRGSQLMRFLSSDLLQGRKALVDVLTDEKIKTNWSCLLLLCQLYSRSLLTIGDDEFYPTDSTFGATPGPSTSASRNPLSLDEIVAFSGILRNLAFSLYWYEGTGGMLDDLGHCNLVGIKKMDLQSLRSIVTRLLQQLHQRDSRRRFAPKDHWLMSSHLDLQSFIQTVVLEEDELNQYHDQAQDPSISMDVDEEVAPQENASRPAISSRIASRRGTNLRGSGYSARNLAYLSPRLGVLNNVPFVIPFETRVEIFHRFTMLDYSRLERHARRERRREVTIRRSHIAQDGFDKLNGLGSQLKHRFLIQFIDQWGMEESGIDGGGLFKEFLTSLVKEAFDTDRGLWSATAEQQLYPSPHSYAKEDQSLQWYKFLGRILGKALYHGILVDVNFASFFLSKWLGKGNSYLDDLSGLESLDKEVYRNLLWLKHYSGDVEKDLTLDFTVTNEEFEVKHTHELVHNGRNIPVTKENRLEYIYRVSHYRLNEQIRLQSEAFLSGLTDIIDLRWLRMLNREELRILISGTEGEIDLEDLKAQTELGGYHEKDEVVVFFWQAMESFTHAQRKAFLKFVTSCPSPPLLGFAQLNPKFGIRNGGDDTTRLPTSSTCVNLLKLPRYKTYEQCREKLLYAIESGAGFDLS